jgi:glycoside/pentoside/hexuronide:cation symporter, GPH family
MARGHAAGERPPLGWPTMVAYSLGAVSQSMKGRIVAVFLLIYYNQVVGLDAALVSTLIMVGVLFDAVVDPVVGQVSDNFRSRLGRRHPFMYAAALPAALLLYMLWNPPTGWGPEFVAVYFVVVLVALNVFDTFFELPALSLLPELAQEYDKRTRLVALRALFSSVSGMLITVLAYQVFLKETPEGKGGALAADGYHSLSVTVALIMFAAMTIATVGTHGQIKWLRAAPAQTPKLAEMLREARATLKNPSFAAVVASGICFAVAAGMRGALDLYWYLYLFELKQSQIALTAVGGVMGALATSLVGPFVIKRFGKPRTAIACILISLVLTLGPMTLWLLNLTPPAGSNALFALLAIDQSLNSGMWFLVGVCTTAMMADVVEDAEVKTGRRSEGLLFAAENLFKKMVGGLGVFGAGLILTFAAFPKGAERGAVPHDVLVDLALLFLPTVGVLYFGAIGGLCFFRIDRAKHEANLAILRARRETERPLAASEPAAHAAGSPAAQPGGAPA